MMQPEAERLAGRLTTLAKMLDYTEYNVWSADLRAAAALLRPTANGSRLPSEILGNLRGVTVDGEV